jgi:hypothetical protein
MSATAHPQSGRQRWPIYASYAATCGMVICFAAVFIQFLVWLAPWLDPRGILLASGLVTLEAFFSFWLVKRLPTAQRQMAYYRVTEIVILLVALKFFTELRAGPASFWTNFLLWPVQFPFNIITMQVFLTALPVLAAWWTANLFAADLALLGTEEALIQDDRTKTMPVRMLILRRFLTMGMIVVALAGIPPEIVIETSLPVVSNAVPAVVAYFAFGICLLSLTRYISLESTWLQARLHIPAQIPRRWFAYSALILAGLVFLVSWLPTNYGLGLFATLNALFHLIYQFILLLYGLILLLFTLLSRLLLRDSGGAAPPIVEVPPQNNIISAAAPGTSGWELVKSILLWGSLLALAVVAIRQYLAFNRDLVEELRRFRPLGWLVTAWSRFKASFKKANQTVTTFIQGNLKRLRRLAPEKAQLGEWDFINLHRLTARQKVIFYYLALVRRANEAGLPRQQSQTPYEYADTLKVSLTEEKDDLAAMTESFIEARYSRHEIPAKTARQAESIWEAIRRVLKNVRKSGREDPPTK